MTPFGFDVRCVGVSVWPVCRCFGVLVFWCVFGVSVCRCCWLDGLTRSERSRTSEICGRQISDDS